MAGGVRLLRALALLAPARVLHASELDAGSSSWTSVSASASGGVAPLRLIDPSYRDAPYGGFEWDRDEYASDKPNSSVPFVLLSRFGNATGASAAKPYLSSAFEDDDGRVYVRSPEWSDDYVAYLQSRRIDAGVVAPRFGNGFPSVVSSPTISSPQSDGTYGKPATWTVSGTTYFAWGTSSLSTGTKNKFYIFSHSSSSGPALVSSGTMANGNYITNNQEVLDFGTTQLAVFVCDNGADVYDVTSPASPVHKSFSTGVAESGMAVSWVSGSTGYVAYIGTEPYHGCDCLKIYSLSSAGSLAHVKTLTRNSGGVGDELYRPVHLLFFMYGTTPCLFVGSTHNHIRVIGVANPASPTFFTYHYLTVHHAMPGESHMYEQNGVYYVIIHMTSFNFWSAVVVLSFTDPNTITGTFSRVGFPYTEDAWMFGSAHHTNPNPPPITYTSETYYDSNTQRLVHMLFKDTGVGFYNLTDADATTDNPVLLGTLLDGSGSFTSLSYCNPKVYQVNSVNYMVCVEKHDASSVQFIQLTGNMPPSAPPSPPKLPPPYPPNAAPNPPLPSPPPPRHRLPAAPLPSPAAAQSAAVRAAAHATAA